MIKGIGTIINALAIIGGGIIGVAGGRFIKKSYQDLVLRATAIAIMFIQPGPQPVGRPRLL